jgi:hypothetical protein
VTKQDLYYIGMQAAMEFLSCNDLPDPVFMTYEAALQGEYTPRAVQLLRRVAEGPVQGTGTGLYSDGHVFVNVPRTAAPVQTPTMRNWSWPGWKTDRTAVGVVAHEVGHYVEHRLQLDGKLDAKEHGPAWRAIISKCRKTVSGYEPVPSEAWAESMRLFILNPDLLQRAIPARFDFICSVGLDPLPRLLRKGYAAIINNAAYLSAAQRFIG